jgi:dienelactone hydrolase
VPTDRTDGELIFTAEPVRHGEPQLITLTTDDGDIPCWLLVPPVDRRLDAAVVAVAGHGPSGIDALIDPRPDADDFHGGLARKLAAAGFTVLCPEMISFGRRRTPMPATVPPTQNTCQVDAMRGLLAGRPVLGRRVADTLAAVRAVRSLDGVDPTKTAVVGGSGGGAVALLAGALEAQLPAVVVGTFFSSFAASIETVPHCICNAVPDLSTWFEMADIAAMIAPRRLIIEAGRHDPIFPVTATETAYAELVDTWQAIGAPSPDLVITDAGHQFLADDSIALLRGHLLQAH